jgi:hypothetical protein
MIQKKRKSGVIYNRKEKKKSNKNSEINNEKSSIK